MTYRNTRQVTLPIFWKGLNTDSSPENIPDWFTPVCFNMRIKDAEIESRMGYATIGRSSSPSYQQVTGVGDMSDDLSYFQSASGISILYNWPNGYDWFVLRQREHNPYTIADRGYFKLIRTDDTMQQLIVTQPWGYDPWAYFNDNLGTYPFPKTRSILLTSYSSTNGRVYSLSWPRSFGYIEGTTFNLISTNIPWGMTLWPTVGAFFNGSLWVARITGNNWQVLIANTVYKSVGENFVNFTSAWSDSFVFDDEITALQATDRALFYFSPRKVWTTDIWDLTDTAGVITYVYRDITAQEWALAQQCVVSAGQSVFYLSPNLHFYRIVRGANNLWYDCIDLSHRNNGIGSVLDRLPRDQTDNAKLIYDVKNNFIKIYLKDSSTSQDNNMAVIYDVDRDLFMVDTVQAYYDAVNYKGNLYWIIKSEYPIATALLLNNKFSYPNIYKDECILSDDGSPIEAAYVSKAWSLTGITRRATIWDARTYGNAEESAQITQKIWVDGVLRDETLIDPDADASFSYWVWADAIWYDAIASGWSSGNSVKFWLSVISKGMLRAKWRLLQIWWFASLNNGRFRVKEASVSVENEKRESNNRNSF